MFYSNRRNKLVKYVDTNKKLRVKKDAQIINDIVDTNFDRLGDFMDEHYDKLDPKNKKYASILKNINGDIDIKHKKKEDYSVITKYKLDEITPACKTTITQPELE